MWSYYNFKQTEFNAHYHKRSNVKIVCSMIKSKFGVSVRAKMPVAQVNEVLCKVLCHNLCSLIQSIYDGTRASILEFWGKRFSYPKQLSIAGF